MRYKKLSFLLVVSLVFFLSVSLVLICAWFYYYFHDNKKASVKTPGVDTLVHQKRYDSLQNLYSASMGTYDTLSAYGNDSLRADINNKLAEFYKLRNEVNVLLRNRNNADDLETARLKIITLQQKMDELKARTLKVESENKRLSTILQQLTNELKPREPNIRKPVSSPQVKIFSEKAIPASASSSLFAISDLKLSAFASGDGIDEETSTAEKTVKLSGAFNVRSNAFSSADNELVVVVLQPNGRVLQSSSWESGTFDTPEGKKIYSSRVNFDYKKGEQKHLSFSVTADEFEKGEYRVMIYHNGMAVGKGSKYLN